MPSAACLPVPCAHEAGRPRAQPRQLEVLRLIAEGKNAREKGRELYLSKSTIRNHTRALLQAFGAHSQLELLAKARRMGVL